MNTFLKISLGFVLGVISTLGLLNIIGATQDTEENRLREEIRMKALKDISQSFDNSDTNEDEQRNIQSFELTTKKGIVTLHTYMSKDSVKILMGRPQSTDINDYRSNDEVDETWKYKGSNKYIDEFTIEFINSELKSVHQYKE
ncbi:MAG: hypothetical protein RIQ62_867 [Bacteroidota bacterium]|jgi:hypothetical protein